MRRRVIGNMMGQPSGGLTGLAYLQSLLITRNGMVYDFTDPTTMYNDTGGVTAVSVGTPAVAMVEDLGANGVDLIQHASYSGHSFDYTEGCLKTPADITNILVADNWAGGSGVTEFLICELYEVESNCVAGGKDRATALGASLVQTEVGSKKVFALSCDNTIRCDGTAITLNSGYPSALALRTWWRESGNGSVRYDGIANTTGASPASALDTTWDTLVIGDGVDVAGKALPWVLRHGLFIAEGTFPTTEIENIESAVANMAGYTY